MNKLILSVIALFTLSFSVLAQDNDPKAKAILDDLSKKTKAYKTITSEYEFTATNKDKKQTDKQTGKVKVKGSKYKLELKSNTIYCDGKTVWTYNKAAKEVSEKEAETGGDDALNPSKIFTMYETGYKYKLEKEEKIGGVTMQVISLFPTVKPDKKKYHTVKLYIDKTKKQIKSMKMMMKDGGVQSYEIKVFTTDKEIADTEFTWDKKTCPTCPIIKED